MHPLAADYLDRLEPAARRLPRGERRELLEDIVDAQLPEEPYRSDRRGTHERAVTFLLLFGGLLFFVGWIAGLVLLWSSRAWDTRDRLIGTLIVPGGSRPPWRQRSSSRAPRGA